MHLYCTLAGFLAVSGLGVHAVALKRGEPRSLRCRGSKNEVDSLTGAVAS